MAGRYVELDSAKFEEFMLSKGFTKTLFRSEVVFVRSSIHDNNLKIKVYSSITEGAEVAREVGSDAVRTVVILEKEDKSYPIFKGSRVYRTGSNEKICSRVSERIVEAEARCAEWLLEQKEKKAVQQVQEPVKQVATKVNPFKEHVGQPGQEMEETLEVIGRKPWNNIFLFTMRDNAGHIFTYWSKKDLLQERELYDLNFVVKRHATFNNVCQTEISDVRGRRVIM